MRSAAPRLRCVAAQFKGINLTPDTGWSGFAACPSWCRFIEGRRACRACLVPCYLGGVGARAAPSFVAIPPDGGVPLHGSIERHGHESHPALLLLWFGIGGLLAVFLMATILMAGLGVIVGATCGVLALDSVFSMGLRCT